MGMAQEAACITMNIGRFFQKLINFLLIGLVLFVALKVIFRKKYNKTDEEKAPQRLCDFCRQVIDTLATRCNHCTATLSEEAAEAAAAAAIDDGASSETS